MSLARWRWPLIFLVSLLCCLPYYGLYEGMDDEAVTTLGAQRLLSGQFPYHDWDTRHFPGSYFLAALWFSVTGSHLFGVRTLMLLVTGLLGVAQYAIARRLLEERRAVAAWLLWICTGVTQWPILSYHWMAIAAYLLTLWLILWWRDQPSARRAAAVGCAIAFTGWILQTEGLALLLVWIPLARRRNLLVSAGALAGATLLLWLPVLATSMPSEIYASSIEAMRWHVPFNRSPFNLHFVLDPSRQVWAQLSHAQPLWLLHSLSMLGAWWFKYGLYYPLLVAAALLSLRRDATFRILTWSQLCLTAACWNRQDMLYLNYLTPVFYVLAVAMLARGVTAVVVALFLLQCAFGWSDAVEFRHPIPCAYGTLRANDVAVGGWLRALYGVAGQITPPGSTTFAYPYAASFYALSGTRPAVRFPVLVPLLYDRREMERALAELDASRPEYVYRFPLDAGVLADYPTVDPQRFTDELAWLHAQIDARYRPVQDIGPFLVCSIVRL